MFAARSFRGVFPNAGRVFRGFTNTQVYHTWSKRQATVSLMCRTADNYRQLRNDRKYTKESMSDICELSGLRVIIRPMDVRDLGQLVSLTSQEMWPTSLEEQTIIYSVYPHGVYTGCFLEDGTLVSHLAFIPITDKLKLAALFVTSRPYRGRKLGINFGVPLLEGCKGIQICDAVVNKVPLYESLQFKLIDIELKMVTCRVSNRDLGSDQVAESTIETRRCGPLDIESVCRYDQTVVGHERTKFLQLWLASQNSIAIVAEDLENDRRVCGYLVMRRDLITCEKDQVLYKGAGFYADSPAVATQLLGDMLSKHLPKGADFWLQYPTTNESSAMEVAGKFGEVRVVDGYTWIKMIRGGNMTDLPSCQWEKVYCIPNCYNVLV